MRNNKKWKRISSGILAVCLIGALVVSNQSFGVFADKEENQTVEQEEPTVSTEQVEQNVDENVVAEDTVDENSNITDGNVTSETEEEPEKTIEEIDTQTSEEAIEGQTDDSKISELIDADVTLLKWKSSGGTATVTLDGTVYNITDDQSYQSTYANVYKQMIDNTSSITADLSTQTISEDTIWNVSNDISMSGNITVESGAHLIIIGTGTITKNGDYGIVVSGEVYLQGQVYFNGNKKNSALIQIPSDSGKVFLADDFRLGNNGGNGITAKSGKIYMVGGLIGTKDIEFNWYNEDNKEIDKKNYENTLSYINKNLSSDEYNYINQITQSGGNTRGINLQDGAVLYMNGGSIAGNGGVTGDGNGINADSKAKIVITGGTIIGNQTKNSGGGLNISCSTTISGGLIAGNHSDNYAGGINMSGTTTLKGNAVIAFNSCDYNGGGMLIAQKATCTMEEEAAVVHNRAIGANNVDNSGKGGAFRVVGTLILNNGKINYNSGNGPLDSKTVEQDIGGAISGQTDILDGKTIRVATVTLNGGEIAYNKAKGRGGAIWMVCAADNYTATFELDGTNVHDNRAASNGGAIFLDARKGTLNANIKSGHLTYNSSEDKGGGIYLLLTKDATALTVNIGEENQQPTDLEITGNSATNIGGGLYVARTENSTGTSNVNLYNGTLSSNQAQNGGALGVSQGNLNVYGGNFQSNTAENGGGAYVASGKLSIYAGSFNGNTATVNGGGAYVADGKVRMFGGSLEANTAQYDGGGLYVSSVENAADVVIRSGKITKNNSGRSGAGIAVGGGNNPKEDKVVLGLLEDHNLTISDTGERSFSSISYTDSIDNQSHTHASCPVLKNNTADGDGGGIYMQSSKAILNIYCLEEDGNISKENTNGNGVMMAGGKMIIGDEEYNQENTTHTNAFGNTVINSPMLVEGGDVDIWGNMNNPLFENNILVDIQKGAGSFKDHRTQVKNDEVRYKIHYFENFKEEGEETASGIYIANQYDAEEDIQALGTLFSHDGWRILGWATEADMKQNKTTYAIGDKIGNKDNHEAWGNDNTQPLILYAIWARSSYTVKFEPNANGNGYSGSMAEQLFYYSVKQKLTPNNYKVTGKRFTGWNTKPDGSGTAYAEDYEESKMTLTNGVTFPLFAQWGDCTHKGGDHPGILSYTKDEEKNTITETCDCGGHTATIELVGQKAYHDGKAHPAIKNITGTLLAGNPEIKYKSCSTEDGNYTDMKEGDVPTETGFYEASITVGEKTISVKYQIQAASDSVNIDANCIDGQRFGAFSGKTTCDIAQDDAFTVLYSIRNLNENYKGEPSLVMEQALPVGTTIIMQTNGSYWYKNIEKETSEIALSAFSKMGGSSNDMFLYNFEKTQDYRFVFDFSKVVKTKWLSGAIKAALVYKHNSSDNDKVEKAVTITFEEEGRFSMAESADSLEIKAPQNKMFSRWDNKNLVLVVTAKDENQFPADARLTVKTSDKTYTYSKNMRDSFVIPITWSTSENVNMYLNSDLMSVKGKTYKASVKLCVGDKVENLTSQPQAKEYETDAQTDISLKVADSASPSVQIIGNQKVVSNKDKLDLTVKMEMVDGCTVHATIQQKEANGYGGKFLDTEVTETENKFNLGGIQKAGSYRLLITVTKDNQELLTVPYYFIVQ